VFTPHPEYWIAFGNFTTGETIDSSSMTNPAQIVFPPNVYSMTATLNADDTWTIAPTSMGNAALAAARATNAKATWADLKI
jgi:hypothetical protein